MLVGHVAAVRCVQYDGRLVVSGAYDYMVKVDRIGLITDFINSKWCITDDLILSTTKS